MLTVRLGDGVRRPNGKRLPARVRFTPTAVMHNGALTAGQCEHDVGEDGTLSGPVAANDDPATLPLGVGYYVEVLAPGGFDRAFYAQLPHTAPGGAVDLDDLVQLVEFDPPPSVPVPPAVESDLFYVNHQQVLAQSVWTVTHAPGIPVAWSLRTAADQLATGYVVDPFTTTTTRVSMDEPTAGVIRLLMKGA